MGALENVFKADFVNKKYITIVVLGLVTLTAAAADELETARHALADKLYEVAERQSLRLLATSGTPLERSGALLVYLQALAEQGRHAEVLKVMESHTATVNAGPAELFSYWRAVSLLATGEAEAAFTTAEAGLEVQPEADDAAALRRLMAKAAMAQGDAAGAVKLYEELDGAVVDPASRAVFLLEWAYALEVLRRFEEAVVVLSRLPADLPGDFSAEQGALLHARLLEKLGRIDAAQELLQAISADIATSESGVVQALVQLARCQLEAGDSATALVTARAARAAAMRPDNKLVAGYRLGEVLLSSTNTIDEGVVCMKGLVREFPEAECARNAQLAMAGALFRVGRYEAAANAYQVYVETFGEEGRGSEALYGRASALFRLNRYSEAANIYQKLHDTTTNKVEKAEALFRAADAVAADERYKQAAQLYREVSNKYEGSPLAAQALFQAADVLERSGETAAAEETFGEVAQRYKKTVQADRALLRQATLLAARNAVDAAVATYGTVLAATTNNRYRVEALMGRGRANYRVFRFTTALQDFSSAAIAGSNDGEAQYWQVMTLYSLGRDDEAYKLAEEFTGSFATAPRRPDITLWLAKYDYNRGKMEEAKERFLVYVEQWPDAVWADAALLWAGRAAFKLNDFTGAVEILGRLWKGYPESKRRAAARFVQADALCELARFDEAVLLLNEVISRYPESDWVTPAWGRKGDALFSLGVDNPERFNEAMEAYSKMLARRDITPTAALQGEFKIGRCLEKLKQADDAIDHYYTKVVLPFERSQGDQFHNDAAVWFARAAFNAADLLVQKGNHAAATRLLRRVIDADVPGRSEARQRLQRLEQLQR